MIITPITVSATTLDRVWQFFETHHDDLLFAVRRFGGETAEQRLVALFVRLAAAPVFDSKFVKEIKWLHSILCQCGLEPVVCNIEPDDPEIERLCAVADAFERTLDEMNQLAGRPHRAV